MQRINCYTAPDGRTESGLSLTEVKRRIRLQGGSGYTQHFDKDGSFQETTPIVLANNARTTYRAEYNTSRKFKEQRDVPGVRTESDVLAILDKVMVQAKAENVAEEDNTRLMQLLTPFLGGHAAWITERWYDWALCIIHGGLHHEYRGMGRSLRRSEAINKWKNENKKENEEDNRQDFGGAVGGDV